MVSYRIAYMPEQAGCGQPVGQNALPVTQFRQESSGRSVRPETRLRLWHDATHIHGRFDVEDCFIRARYQGFQQPVYRDSCVELFLQPDDAGGYFNFEFNALGAMLLYWIENPVRKGDGFQEYTVLPDVHCQQVRISPSLRHRIDPEQPGPLHWSLSFSIPLALLEMYAGPLGILSGQRWRGNAYKCADESSHPHWASWSPVTGALDFHQPDCFGEFVFE